jgi:replication factor C large subunit
VSEYQPWTHKYRPKSHEDFVGNEKAVAELERWVKSWRRKPPSKKAVFIYGPPGVGKTSVVHVLAHDNGYELVEINASDTRNKSSIEETLGKTVKQNVTLFGHRRMILLDEMDGLSGQQDRGGISTIAKIIDETSSPMVLVANTVRENMEDRFRSILRKTKSIEFKALSFSEIFEKLEKIVEDQGSKVYQDVLEELAMNSGGDLRSAIVDLETVARGKKMVTLDDLGVLNERDRLDYTPNILNKIFTSRSLWEARHTINESMISYDDLFDWIYENIPIAIDEPTERMQALDKLSKADIYQNRAKSFDYRLLKYMFDQMTGGISLTRRKSKGEGYREQLNSTIRSVGLTPSTISFIDTPEGVMIKPNSWLGKDKWNILNQNLRDIGARWIYGKNVWVLPYYREPQAKWRYISTYHRRRRINSVVNVLARKCHTSSQRARSEILPIVSYMIENDRETFNELANWIIDIHDKKLDHLRYQSFKKGPSDFANLENYSRYKEREIQKSIEEADKQKETDQSNVAKWLEEERKKASWSQ